MNIHKPTNKHVRCQNGFTIVETLIGMTIFTIGLLGILMFQSVSIKNNTRAQTSTENTHNAMGTIERIFAINWNDPGAQPEPGITEQIDANHSVTWQITESPAAGVVTMTDDTNSPNVRLITVTAEYDGDDGMSRSVTFRLLKPRM